MDWRRSCCYVGEAGKGKGGISKRLEGHARAKNEKWWSDVVYFVDSNNNPIFDEDKPRMWVEWELFRRASRVFPVVTAVDSRDEAGRSDDALREVLDICRVLGVPFFQTPQELVQQEDLFSYAAREQSERVSSRAPSALWVDRGALAREIAKRFNGGKGASGLDMILSGKRKAGAKWIRILNICKIVHSDGWCGADAWKSAVLPFEQ